MNKKLVVFAFDDSYIAHGVTAISSLLENNCNIDFEIGILTDSFSENTYKSLRNVEERYSNCTISVRNVDEELFSDFGLSISYISKHTYYRYLIADLFKEYDQALYLDSDLIVNGSLSDLFTLSLDGYAAAAVEDSFIKSIDYASTLGFSENDLYFNAGVILFNLKEIRKYDLVREFFKTNNEFKDYIFYQDQDVLNLVLKDRVLRVSELYNYTLRDVEDDLKKGESAIIIHYTGVIKPWTKCKRHPNKLDYLYFKYLAKTSFGGNLRKDLRDLKYSKYLFKAKPKKRIALIIDEYFGALGTAFGGYGFLARNLIAKYVPDEEYSIEVLLNVNSDKWHRNPTVDYVDGVKVMILPGRKFAKRWMQKQQYDLYLSIEYTWDLLKYVKDKNAKLLHWIQDPRPWYEWKEINTVKLFPEDCYWTSDLYDRINKWNSEGRVRFVTQGYCLEEKAKDLYRLPEDTAIEYLPNPVEIDYGYSEDIKPKENMILFIGRIESVKRGWIFCEIAKRMPGYQFYMMGQSFRDKEKNDSMMSSYTSIPNLHFIGHLEGKDKKAYLERAKILVNTSIHEAIPITFLEALSYGVLLVSCRNPDDLTSRFGKYVGQVLGDGFDKVDLFVEAIHSILSDDIKRKDLSQKAISYTRETHGLKRFVEHMRKIFTEMINN